MFKWLKGVMNELKGGVCVYVSIISSLIIYHIFRVPPVPLFPVSPVSLMFLVYSCMSLLCLPCVSPMCVPSLLYMFICSPLVQVQRCVDRVGVEPREGHLRGE